MLHALCNVFVMVFRGGFRMLRVLKMKELHIQFLAVTLRADCFSGFAKLGC